MSSFQNSTDDRPWAGAGPSALILPVLVLVFWVLWTRHGLDLGGGERAEPPASSAVLMVDGWVGSGAVGVGSRLEARLVSLHGPERRQAFDRDKLAARLGRDGGQPWQLELRLRAGTDGAETSLDLRSLLVSDSAGSQLVPLVRERPVPPEGGVTDPLLSLLAAPRELSPGTGVTVVLWGDPPGAGALLTIAGAEITLHEEAVPSVSIMRTLARHEWGGPR